MVEPISKPTPEGVPLDSKPTKQEIGLVIQIIPAITPEQQAMMSKRNYRRLILDKARTIGIRGLALDKFLQLEITDQFLLLRRYIPDNWRPGDIGAWYATQTEIEEIFPKVSAPHFIADQVTGIIGGKTDG